MKYLSSFIAATALLSGSVVMAQDAATNADAGTQMGEAEADAMFSDSEIELFTSAALKLQALEGGPAANQEEAAAIVSESGIDRQTFNAISEAMRTDPKVVERVQAAAAELRSAE